jgi:hypothetical protein
MSTKTIQTILNLKDNFSSGMKTASENTKQTQRSIRLLRNNVESFRKNAVSSFTSVATSVGKMGLAFGGVALGAGIFTAFSEASGLEGFRMQLETATKDTKKAADIMKWSVDLANRTPFETSSVVEASARLEAMGLSAKKFLPVIGDMAGATNKDLMQASEAVIDAQTGELERLKEFGITKAMIVKQAYEKMGKIQVVNNKGQITNQGKFNEALMTLMGEKFKGGMDKQAGTLKGLWSTVTGVTKTALAGIVGVTNEGTIRQGSLMEILKEKVKSVGDTFTKWQSDGTVEKIGANITKAIEIAKKAFAGFVETIKWAKDNASWLIPVIAGLTTAILAQKAINGIVGMYKAWKTATLALSTAQGAMNVIMALNPFGLIAIAIGVLVVAGILLWKNWDKVSAFLKKTWESTKQVASTVFTAIGDFFTKLWSDVKSITESVWNGIKSFFLLIWESIKFIFFNLTLAGILIKHWDLIKSTIVNVWNGIAGFLSGLWTGITTNASLIFNGIVSFLSGVWTSVSTTVTSVWNGIGSTISSVWDGIVSGIKGSINIVIDAINTLIRGMNTVQIKIPDWIPSIGGKSFGMNVPEIPKFATGTGYFQGGLAKTNEHGGEIKEYPNGTKVYPHDVSMQMAKGKGSDGVNVYLTVQGNMVGNEDFANYLGDIFFKKIVLAHGNV